MIDHHKKNKVAISNMDESKKIMLMSQHVLKKDWNNKYDDCWNE